MEGPTHSEGVGYVAHVNMEIVQNSSFLAVIHKNTRNGHGGAVTMVPYVVFVGSEKF